MSGDHRRAATTLRRYRYTATYLVAAVTVILALLVWDRVEALDVPACDRQPANTEKGQA